MTNAPDHRNDKLARRNRTVGIIFACVAVGMVGAAYAAVPLYSIFCQVTGYNGTTKRATGPADRVLDRVVKVQFDSNVSNDMPWIFRPKQHEVKVRIGEPMLIFYEAENTSDKTVTGSAVFNVSPSLAGYYFNKIQCFCFTQQTLKPGEKVDMPVQFYIDPDIEKDADLKELKTLTLSYTFYPVDKPKQTSGLAGTGQAAN
jgi:cytochrome c oxidase assembly protein subunit 11